ncbi:hypothetical protein A6J66_000805 [Yersinia enterocolitica]|nr:hypothetical protein A6J66_000805 [Yersinia enterocolitica]
MSHIDLSLPHLARRIDNKYQSTQNGPINSSQTQKTVEAFLANPTSATASIGNSLGEQIISKMAKNPNLIDTTPSTFTLRLNGVKYRIYNLTDESQMKRFQSGESIDFINSKGENKSFKFESRDNASQDAIFTCPATLFTPNFLHFLSETAHKYVSQSSSPQGQELGRFDKLLLSEGWDYKNETLVGNFKELLSNFKQICSNLTPPSVDSVQSNSATTQHSSSTHDIHGK